MVETAETGLNVYARDFIPRHTGTQHVWNVDAPSFVPAQSFTKLNVFAKEFVPRPCDFVRENRMDYSSTVSVDVCVPKCNDPQVRICDFIVVKALNVGALTVLETGVDALTLALISIRIMFIVTMTVLRIVTRSNSVA